MTSLSHYYHSAKHGMMNINPKEAAQLGEDWLIAGGTGMLLGLMSAATGGMDKKIAGFNVPMDGAMAFGLALAGLSMGVPELKTASIAAGGSAAARTFEGFFKKALNVHGDFDWSNVPISGDPPQIQSQFSWGQDSHDQLVAAARNL